MSANEFIHTNSRGKTQIGSLIFIKNVILIGQMSVSGYKKTSHNSIHKRNKNGIFTAA
jgi:hypothetical protein